MEAGEKGALGQAAMEERPAWKRAGGQPPLPPMDLVSLRKLRQTNPRKKKKKQESLLAHWVSAWAGAL